MWLLHSAPGLPRTDAISFADLGAGTCAACLGARLALRDFGGDEQVGASSTPSDHPLSTLRPPSDHPPTTLLPPSDHPLRPL